MYEKLYVHLGDLEKTVIQMHPQLHPEVGYLRKQK